MTDEDVGAVELDDIYIAVTTAADTVRRLSIQYLQSCIPLGQVTCHLLGIKQQRGMF